MLKVANWSKFQHYKDRKPLWIKLHRSLLDDLDFVKLPLVARALLPMFWLVASDSQDGTLPDLEGLAWKLRMSEDEVADALMACLDGGFLVEVDEPGKPFESPWQSRYIPKAVREAVWKRDKGICVACCYAGPEMEFDHIVPISKGGSSTEENVQLLCRSCNRKKRNRVTPAEQTATDLEQAATIKRSLETERETETETEGERETDARARAKSLWEAVCRKVDVPDHQKATWLRPTEAMSLEDSTLTVMVPGESHARWIRTNYIGKLQAAIPNLKLRFVLGPPATDAAGPAA